MSYTPLTRTDAGGAWPAGSYTPLSAGDAGGAWPSDGVTGWVSLPGPLGAPAALGQTVAQGAIALPGPLGAPAMYGQAATWPAGWVALPGPLGVPAAFGQPVSVGALALPGPLGAPSLLGTPVVSGHAALPGPLGTPAALGRVMRYEVRGAVRLDGIALARRVRCYRLSDGQLLGEADTAAGKYRVPAGLVAGELVTVIALDMAPGAQDWRPTAANRLAAVLADDTADIPV